MLQKCFYKQAHQIIKDRSDSYSDQDLQHYVRNEINNEPIEIQDRIINEFFNYGPLHSLIENQNISEIIINGYDGIIYEEKGRFIKHNDEFYSPRTFENFIHKITFETKTQIDLKTPHLNTSWKNFRVHIICKPITKKTCVTLRRHSMNSWNFKKLEENQWAQPREIEYILQSIKDQKNILIVGPTGSGKTTILNSCLQVLDPLDRCVIIEDTNELICPNVSSTKLLTRTEQFSDLRTYDQSDLLKQSLRMRPQRLIIGEIRGSEAKDYLMALSTGHEGGLCSMHANHPRQALIRLEMLIQLGAPQWSLQAIRQLIQLSLNIIITVGCEHSQRHLKSIHQISSLESHGFILEEIYSYEKEKSNDLQMVQSFF